MNVAHMAIHFSGDRRQAVIIVQPRNRRGQFLSPLSQFSGDIHTSHVTLNGTVVRTLK